MLSVIDSFVEQCCNVVVIESVGNTPTLPRRDYKSEHPQQTQLVRNG